VSAGDYPASSSRPDFNTLQEADVLAERSLVYKEIIVVAGIVLLFLLRATWLP
jgi:hypothetical protein